MPENGEGGGDGDKKAIDTGGRVNQYKQMRQGGDDEKGAEVLYSFLCFGASSLKGRTGKDLRAPSGNRTRVKGVEDPHSTTELSAQERR